VAGPEGAAARSGAPTRARAETGGPAMMRRLFAQQGQAVVREEPVPQLRAGEVLVATEHSVMSPGTERHIIEATARGSAEAHEYPRPGYRWPKARSAGVSNLSVLPREPSPLGAALGYSLAGKVLAVGADVMDMAPGDRVACAGSQCAFHAEVVAVPRNLTVPVPPDVATEDAAFVTLGSIAMESLRRTGCRFGETVMVCGAGLLGLLITQLASVSGIYVIAMDIDPERLALAQANGASYAIGAASAGAAEEAHRITGGFGADAAIIAAASGDNGLVNFALDSLRLGGRVVALGAFGMDMDRARFFRAQATLVPSVAYGPGRYDPVYEENNVDYPVSAVRWTEARNMAHFLRLLAEGKIVLGKIPACRADLREAASAYESVARRGGPLTAVLSYAGSPYHWAEASPGGQRG
jgi:threonine dehydrogenase-like Zn-dependent dehydrogenase